MRLIDADALIDDMCEDCGAFVNGVCDKDVCASVLWVKDAPAVDAVEVVRCFQCKHWEPMNKGSWMYRNRTDGVCRTLMEFRLAERYMTEKDHFCGFGERREE